MHSAVWKIPRSFIVGYYGLHGDQSAEKIHRSFSSMADTFTTSKAVELMVLLSDEEFDLSEDELST